jgi:hypothetical protein
MKQYLFLRTHSTRKTFENNFFPLKVSHCLITFYSLLFIPFAASLPFRFHRRSCSWVIDSAINYIFCYEFVLQPVSVAIVCMFIVFAEFVIFELELQSYGINSKTKYCFRISETTKKVCNLKMKPIQVNFGSSNLFQSYSMQKFSYNIFEQK